MNPLVIRWIMKFKWWQWLGFKRLPQTIVVLQACLLDSFVKDVGSPTTIPQSSAGPRRSPVPLTNWHRHTHTHTHRFQVNSLLNLPTCFTLTTNHLCYSHIREKQGESAACKQSTNTHKHTHTPVGWVLMYVWPCVCVSTVYPQRPGSSEHSPVGEQHREDLWLRPGQRHIQRPRLRQERQRTASPHSLYFYYPSPFTVGKHYSLFPTYWCLKAQASRLFMWPWYNVCLVLAGSSAFEVDGSGEHLWQSLHQPEWRVVFWSSALGNLFTG